MKEHKGCKHLDYSEENYPSCTLIKTSSGWYWKRNELPYEGAPVMVQFCKLRGRMNGIFQCINRNEMSCYED
jgi:hypothetical protein